MKKLLLILFSLLSINAFSQHLFILKVNKRVQLNSIATLPTRIAWFGDSFTKGAPSDGGSTYPFKIAVTYPSIPDTVYAVGGTKVCTGTYAPSGGQDLIDLYTLEIAKGYHTGNMVCFCYGKNDAGTPGLINASWKAAYKAIIQAFITAGWPPHRLLIMKQPYNHALITDVSLIQQYVDQIASELGILEYDVRLTFINTGINDSYFDGSDHPLNAGQVVWANGIPPYLYQYFIPMIFLGFKRKEKVISFNGKQAKQAA